MADRSDDHTKKTLTTSFGAPVADNEHSLTAGDRGPVLLQDYQLIEKLAHSDRERIPERVVHAKGAGAFGYFEATADMSTHTRAHLFGAEGRKTPVLVRFSTVGGEKGSADADRDPPRICHQVLHRGGKLRPGGEQYTGLLHSRSVQVPRHGSHPQAQPAIEPERPRRVLGLLSRSPESTHMVTILFSDGGIPRSYREMHGSGVTRSSG